MDSLGRQIFVHGPYGERQIRETLSDLLVGLILSPDTVWLVSPWVSDFDLLDNRSGDWTSLNPSWGARFVMFSELLAAGIDAGCELRLVTNGHDGNARFYERATKGLSQLKRVQWKVVQQLHTKGLLCTSFFLSGSMNFTYSGINRNDEHLRLSIDSEDIADARLEFEEQYAK
jgi:hypothetical protein